jgi:hypothetical protein
MIIKISRILRIVIITSRIKGVLHETLFRKIDSLADNTRKDRTQITDRDRIIFGFATRANPPITLSENVHL